MSVMVVLQNSGKEWHRASFEALTAGRRLAEWLSLPLDAVVLGLHQEAMAGQAAEYRVNRIYLLDHPLLREYTTEGYTIALHQLVRDCSPSFVLFPHTYQVRDYAPKLAARFGCSLLSDVMDMKFEAGGVRFIRQIFLGKIHAEISAMVSPAFISIQTGAFRPMEPLLSLPGAAASASNATMERVNIRLETADIRSKPEAPFRTMQTAVDLKSAGVIVSVGRGVKQKEDLSLVEALAKELGAELAASRPVCDSGWVSMDRLVGSSGQTVAPHLYVAVGISGAIQHLLGMKDAKTIVAINSDASAPIFDNAHYGIVGDLRTILPALVNELRKTKLVD